MSVSKSFAQACKQVVAVLDHFPDEGRKMIPEELYDFYKRNMDESFAWEYKEGLPPEEQDFSKKANAIIITIFRDYFATEKQKEQLEMVLRQNDEIIKERQYKRLMEKEDNA